MINEWFNMLCAKVGVGKLFLKHFILLIESLFKSQ